MLGENWTKKNMKYSEYMEQQPDKFRYVLSDQYLPGELFDDIKEPEVVSQLLDLQEVYFWDSVGFKTYGYSKTYD